MEMEVKNIKREATRLNTSWEMMYTRRGLWGKVNCLAALRSEAGGENVKVCVAYLLSSSGSGPPRPTGRTEEEEGPAGGRE